MKETSHIIVSTADLRTDYDVIGPVYFQVSNKGIFGSQLNKLITQYRKELADLKAKGQLGQFAMDWGFLYGEFSVGQTEFDTAFFIAVEEIKKRALLLDADGVINMRQDIDLDTNGFQFFYLQMYGTAVRFKERPARYVEPPVVIEKPKPPVSSELWECPECGSKNLKKKRKTCWECGHPMPEDIRTDEE